MMLKRKILLTALIIGSIFSTNNVMADPIVELAAPRIQSPKIIPDGDSGGTIQVPEAAQTTVKKPKILTAKKSKKHIRKKPPIIKLNYDKISKLIEYGYYEDADKALEGAIYRNPKDEKALALWVVSLAKQSKLDPAQCELNELIKKYPNNSNLHYAQGVIYYQRTSSSNMVYRNDTQNLVNKAMNEFQKAICLDKNNASAYNAAGVVSINQNNLNDAKNYFNKALAADKTYSLAIDNLGTIDLMNGKIEDAQKKFKESLTYNTQNTTAMYHLAQIAMQKHDYSNALAYLNNALYINQNSPAIYNLMGKAYVQQGNEAAAINAFRKSLLVKPEFTLSYLDLADIYQKRGDGEFALEQLKTALVLEPNNNDAKLKVADISLSSGKYAQAISVYSELVGIDDYNSAAVKGLANAYFAQAQNSAGKAITSSNKDLYCALDFINKAIESDNRDLELHLAKLKLAKLTNQPDLTQVELDKIVQSKADDLMSNIVKGEAYISMGDYKNANEAFESAIEQSQTSDDDLYLSELFIYHRQLSCAEKVIQKVLKSDPQNQQALNDFDNIQKIKKYAANYLKSAQYFVKAKNYTLATEYLTRSLAANPNNAEAHLLLAQMDEKQKDYDDALRNYKTYLNLTPTASNAKAVEKKIKFLENKL